MDKYRHRVSFRLEKRKDKNGNLPEELPINADITFCGKHMWYSTRVSNYVIVSHEKLLVPTASP